ncbi:putative disease resistance RPP13-like protein 1 [Vigna umbellata]|uniref:putative disease resistance RPP13-like protein 1 n=1 Tax=Vigna umbellata TaxID=87088 RepID=UPI001F5EA424|nr:putative disease resistance RPP13-like protein 1 [Vigna umbellata]
MAVQLITDAALSKFFEKTFDILFSRFEGIFRGDNKSKKKQISNLKGKLLAIDVVADDAEQKQFTNPRVRDWLLAAKDAVYDAEDLLEEIDHDAKEVCNPLTSSFISFFENKFESRMEKLIEDLEDLATQSHVLGLKKADDVGVSGWVSKLRSTYLPNESVIYGRDDDKKFVFEWLTSNTHNNLSILSIVGMPGVGKTTLAQHLFNDPSMNKDKFEVKVWVCVSDEFDVFKVSRAILEAVTKSTDDSRDLEMVHRRLKEKLLGKKFLLVLDDVWNENQSKWEEVQKPLVFGAQGSRILVTTRNKEVARIMQSEEHSLEQLQYEHSWRLFAKHAFGNDDTKPNPKYNEIDVKIVKKCKGLPLALKTMGSLLYNKSSVPEWETVLQSEIWEFSQERCDIVPALALSYIHLPSHLKVCFAYCALFPKDYEFRKEDLIQLWMTENFLHCHQHSKSPEEACQQYFNDLKSRSLFQPLTEKKEVFVMHDLLNDLAKYVAGGIYFRGNIDQTKKIQEVTRHFSFELGYDRHFEGFGTLYKRQRLRTFMPTGRSMDQLPCYWNCKISIPELFAMFSLLRILSLSHCSDLKEVPDCVGNLKYLRSLDLSRTAIKKLSESICSLSRLQILKLNYCGDLVELPSNLNSLTSLCRLEFIETKVIKVPDLKNLKNLKLKMSSFNVGCSSELGIQRLGELNNLHESLSIDELEKIEKPRDASEANLKNNTHLVKLELKWNSRRKDNPIDSKKEEDVIDKLQPSKNLKELSIFSYGGTQFPDWLLEDSSWEMVSLAFKECKSCQRLPPLGLWKDLKDLKIGGLDGIVSIDADFYGNNSSSFNSLENLEISDMKQLEKWECKAVRGAFPSLKRLSISNCPKLKGDLPEQLVPLNDLKISHCDQALTVTALKVRWPTMKRLKIDGDYLEASMVKIVWHFTSLEVLDINSHSKTNSDESVSPWTFPLHFFPTLSALNLRGFLNLQMISQDDRHNHLKYLTIEKCPKFESLPESMHTLLPSLMRLSIYDCQKLESFPHGGLPSNLNFVKLQNCCSTLIGSLKGALRANTLKSLWIGLVDAECFPDEGLLPLSLTSLCIYCFENLKKLDYEGLRQLSSLEKLSLRDCPNLESLPEEGLPESISQFSISGNCPLLKHRCQKEVGEDWEKISQIQNLDVE